MKILITGGSGFMDLIQFLLPIIGVLMSRQ